MASCSMSPIRPVEEVYILLLEFDKVFCKFFAHACIFIVNSRVILLWKPSV